MPNVPAVCPLCAHVHTLDPKSLPEHLACEACGAALTPKAHGAALLLEQVKAERPEEKPEVVALLEEAEREKRPDRAHKRLLRALEADPESFAAHRALLYHGKLHECLKRPGDYSLIKCYLLHMYEEPQEYTGEQRDAKVEELFRDPQYLRTRELSGDAEAFETEYLRHLACEYFRIFLRGRSGIGRGMLGFSRSAETIRRIGEGIARRMRDAVDDDERLTQAQRDALNDALNQALTQEM